MWQSGEVNNGGQSRVKRLASLGALLAYDPVSGAEELPPEDRSAIPPTAAVETVAGEENVAVDTVTAPEVTPAAGEAQVDGGATPPGIETHGLPGIQNAAHDIAQTITGILTSALSEVNQRTDDGRRRMDSFAARLDGALERIALAEERIEEIHKRTPELGEQVQSVFSRMSELESSIGSLTKRLDGIFAQVQQDAEALARLSASSDALSRSHHSLHARLLLTERALRAAQMDRRQNEVTWERFVGSLKNLEMRGEKRFPTSESVRAVLVGEENKTISAQVVDVSDRGLGLFLEEEVAAGSTMRIDIEDASLSGTVRYCRPQAEGFAVGVLLEQPLRSQGDEVK
jgi:phage shock protein A